MSTPIINMATAIQCPHAIPATVTSSASKVLVDSTPPLLVGDKGTVAGCPFTVPSGKPQPCTTALLTLAASKVLVENKPVLLMNPSDICQSVEQIPQGPVVWANIQAKVLGA